MKSINLGVIKRGPTANALKDYLLAVESQDREAIRDAKKTLKTISDELGGDFMAKIDSKIVCVFDDRNSSLDPDKVIVIVMNKC